MESFLFVNWLKITVHFKLILVFFLIDVGGFRWSFWCFCSSDLNHAFVFFIFELLLFLILAAFSLISTLFDVRRKSGKKDSLSPVTFMTHENPFPFGILILVAQIVKFFELIAWKPTWTLIWQKWNATKPIRGLKTFLEAMQLNYKDDDHLLVMMMLVGKEEDMKLAWLVIKVYCTLVFFSPLLCSSDELCRRSQLCFWKMLHCRKKGL